MPINFSQEKQDKIIEELQKLCELYFVVKEFVIYFEENNPEQDTDIQLINELRNAFDHLMRSFAVWLEIKKEKSPYEYILTNIDKAFGHVYRAGYDTLDLLVLIFKEIIYKDINEYSSEAINKVIPEYYTKIRPLVYDLNEKITKYRKEKDVSSENYIQLFEYIKEVKKLVNYHKELSPKLPALDEYEAKLNSEKDKENKKSWFKDIILVILSALAGYIISKFF
jgi:hypothetical protein